MKLIRPENRAWFRTLVVYSAFLLGAAALAAHLSFLQFNPQMRTHYADAVQNRWMWTEPAVSCRGDILFSDGGVIACSQRVANIIVDPKIAGRLSAVAWILAQALEKPAKSVDALINDSVGMVTVADDISSEVAQKIEEQQLDGVFCRRYKRDNGETITCVEVDPGLVSQESAVAMILGKHLDIPAAEIDETLQNHENRGAEIARNVPAAVGIGIEGENLRGVYTAYNYQRYYPHGQYGAAATIGYAGPEPVHRTGLEYAWDEYLTGKDGDVTYMRDAHGLRLPGSVTDEHAKRDGADLVTTLDQPIQLICEDELRQAVAANRADWACIIVMDPDSGAVLGLATHPSYDPNEYVKGNIGIEYNVAVHRVVEPGSTVKPLLAACALENNWLSPEKRFDCSKKLVVGGSAIREAEMSHVLVVPGGAALRDIIVHSSNIGMAQVALNLGQEFVKSAYESVGFFSRTGIELPLESKGMAPYYYAQCGSERKLTWPRRVLANAGFGQGLSVTPLQLTAAYCTIANGGRLVQPTLIARSASADSNLEQGSAGPKLPQGEMVISGAAGEVDMATGQPNRRQVFSAKTSDEITSWLIDVVETGTGKKAQLERYQAAGKTGTGQVAAQIGGYQASTYTASFVGFFPARDPQYVVLAMFVGPKGGVYYGGAVAAPVFKAVGDRISYLEQISRAGVLDAS
jgi:cell division protein FtsI/penicillin-binding protein 2